MIDQAKLDSQLMLDEGLRLIAYRDQRGHLTTGVGRNLDTNPLSATEIAQVGHDARTRPITHADALYLLHNDEEAVCAAMDEHMPWWSDLDDVRARVLVDLCFNMGVHKTLSFNTFLALMHQGNYQDAADDLQQTAWYGEVAARGPRLVGMVATGEDYTA